MEKLRMKDVFTSEAYEGMTARERRIQLKWVQAQEHSGLRRYPTTCQKVFDRIPADWITQYSAEHIGDIAQIIKRAYEDGKNSKE